MYSTAESEKNPSASEKRVLKTFPIIISVISTSYVFMKYRLMASAMKVKAIIILPTKRPSHNNR